MAIGLPLRKYLDEKPSGDYERGFKDGEESSRNYYRDIVEELKEKIEELEEQLEKEPVIGV